jgi:hypothetical protein
MTMVPKSMYCYISFWSIVKEIRVVANWKLRNVSPLFFTRTLTRCMIISLVAASRKGMPTLPIWFIYLLYCLWWRCWCSVLPNGNGIAQLLHVRG